MIAHLGVGPEAVQFHAGCGHGDRGAVGKYIQPARESPVPQLDRRSVEPVVHHVAGLCLAAFGGPVLGALSEDLHLEPVFQSQFGQPPVRHCDLVMDLVHAGGQRGTGPADVHIVRRRPLTALLKAFLDTVQVAAIVSVQSDRGLLVCRAGELPTGGDTGLNALDAHTDDMRGRLRVEEISSPVPATWRGRQGLQSGSTEV